MSRLGGRKAWALVAGLMITTLAVARFNASELFDFERAWILSHPLPDGRVRTWEIRDAEHAWALVVFSLLFALVAALPALFIVGRLAKRARRRPVEAMLAAALSAFIIVLQFGRIQTVVGGWLPNFFAANRPVLLTPPVEEAGKLLAAALVLVVALPRGARAGIVMGLAAGIGFNVIEAALYVQKGAIDGLPHAEQWTMIWMRSGLLGFGLHPIAAGLSAAGLGIALESRLHGLRRAAPALIGLAAAILVHAAWNTTTDWINAIVIPIFHPNPDMPLDAPTGLVVGSIAALPILIVPIAALVLLWHRYPGWPDPEAVGHEADPGDRAALLLSPEATVASD